MNIVADEGVDRPIVTRLREQGHDVLYIAEIAPSISDDEVLVRANEHNALLLTADKDFGELVFRLGRISTGVVLIRLAGVAPMLKADMVAGVFESHAAELMNAFSVISHRMVRIRPRLS